MTLLNHHFWSWFPLRKPLGVSRECGNDPFKPSLLVRVSFKKAPGVIPAEHQQDFLYGIDPPSPEFLSPNPNDLLWPKGMTACPPCGRTEKHLLRFCSTFSETLNTFRTDLSIITSESLTRTPGSGNLPRITQRDPSLLDPF